MDNSPVARENSKSPNKVPNSEATGVNAKGKIPPHGVETTRMENGSAKIAGNGPQPVKTAAKSDASQIVNAPTESTPLLPVRDNNTDSGNKYRDILMFALAHSLPVSTMGKFFAISSLGLRMCESGFSLVKPLTMKGAIDSLSVSTDIGWTPYYFIFAYVGLTSLSSLTSRVRRMSWDRASLEQQRGLSVASFAHIHAMSLEYLCQKKMGRVIYMTDRGINALLGLMSTAMFDIAPILLETVAIVALLVQFKSPAIAGVIFVSVAIYILLTLALMPREVEYRKAEIETRGRLFDRKYDSLFNFELVKHFGVEKRESDAYEQLIVADQQMHLKKEFFGFWSGETKLLVTRCGLLVTLVLSAHSVAIGKVSPGAFVAVNTYFYQLFNPLTRIADLYKMITKRLTDLEEFIDFIYKKPDIVDAPNARDVPMEKPRKINGVLSAPSSTVPAVEFEDVSFFYGPDGSTKAGVRNLNLKVPNGKMVALVGPSGAGKSTAIRLLLRLYDVKSGRVLIGGEDVRLLRIKSLRDHISIVPQDTVLFNNSLRYNITYGKPEASDAEIYGATKAAALGDFISGLSEGLETMVGERGLKLSGGERQRVGLARCILTNPSIMILDESTSSLDTLTEKEIQQNLREICRGRTVIAIAHRLSTIMMADEILVFKDGTIIERGTHEDLLELVPNGIYAQMWRAQVGSMTTLPENDEPKFLNFDNEPSCHRTEPLSLKRVEPQRVKNAKLGNR